VPTSKNLWRNPVPQPRGTRLHRTNETSGAIPADESTYRLLCLAHLPWDTHQFTVSIRGRSSRQLFHSIHIIEKRCTPGFPFWGPSEGQYTAIALSAIACFANGVAETHYAPQKYQLAPDEMAKSSTHLQDVETPDPGLSRSTTRG
jgi:hypothetical protein